MLYEAQGRYEEAEPLYNEAVLLLIAGLGPRHPNTVTVLGNYMALLERQGQEQALTALLEQKPELRETLAILNSQNTKGE